MTDQPHGLGPTRARILALLQSSATPLTINAIAGVMGMHKNSARFHLDGLVEAGYAERRKDTSGLQGRPPMLYHSSAAAPSISNLHLVELVETLIGTLIPQTDDGMAVAERAGRAWAGNLGPADPSDDDEVVRELVRQLSERGYTTEVDGGEMLFNRCPFRGTVSPEQLPTICAMHQGFLDAFVDGTGVEVGQLERGPVQCRVALQSKSVTLAS